MRVGSEARGGSLPLFPPAVLLDRPRFRRPARRPSPTLTTPSIST